MSPINMKVKNVTRDTLLADRIHEARDILTRMKGLLGTCDLPEGEGMWISPCRNIHSFGMRYEFDAIFLDREERVLGAYRYFGRNRISRTFLDARGVLELPAGTVDKSGTMIGDIVRFTPWLRRK